MYKVTYTDNIFGDSGIETIRYRKADMIYEEAKSASEEDIISACEDADAVVTCYGIISENVISKLKKCKVIVKAGMGVNNIDILKATERGIMVANVQKYCLEEVSDHAVALTMSLLRKTALMDRLCRQGKWDPISCRPIFRIHGLSFCLYGFGNIARFIAGKMKGLGFRVFAFDPFLSDSVFEDEGVERITVEEELFKSADVLAVQLNLTPKTAKIISYEKMKLMKPSAILINTGRGGLIDEQGLIKALAEGVIGGAGLDVLTEENPDLSSPIFQFENVCITPHIAYYSTTSDKELREKTCDQVIQALTKGMPEFILNGKELGKSE